MKDCSVCHQPALSYSFSAYDFDHGNKTFELFRCSHCFVSSVEPLLDSKSLQAYYHPEYYGGGNEKKSNKKFIPFIENWVKGGNKRRGKKLLQLLRQSLPANTSPNQIKVLDVGCGRGNFLKALAEDGYQCVGNDIAEFDGQLKHHQDQSFSFLPGPLEDLKLESNSFDAVSIWHVLEHVPRPDRTLEEIARILKPGGVLAVAVPHFSSWQSRLFGRHWFHLDLPRHLFHFDSRTISFLLQRQNLQPIVTQTLSWDQNLFGWIQSFQNVLFHRIRPNELFAQLKKPNSTRQKGEPALGYGLRVFTQFFLAGISVIPALFETLLSSFFGKGATLIVYARKSENSDLLSKKA